MFPNHSHALGSCKLSDIDSRNRKLEPHNFERPNQLAKAEEPQKPWLRHSVMSASLEVVAWIGG